MSGSYRVTVACRGSALDALDRWLLTCIAMRGDETGECWAGHRTLVDDSGICDGALRRRLKRLVELGVVEARKRAGTSTVYHVEIDRIPRHVAAGGPSRGADPQPTPDRHVVQGGSARGADVGPSRGDGGSSRGAEVPRHVVQGGSSRGADDPYMIRPGDPSKDPTVVAEGPTAKLVVHGKATRPTPAVARPVGLFANVRIEDVRQTWAGVYGPGYPFDRRDSKRMESIANTALTPEPTDAELARLRRAMGLYVQAARRGEAFPPGDPPTLAHFERELAKWLQHADGWTAPARGPRGFQPYRAGPPDPPAVVGAYASAAELEAELRTWCTDEALIAAQLRSWAERTGAPS